MDGAGSNQLHLLKKLLSEEESPMRNLFVFVFLLSAVAFGASAEVLPKQTGYVSDYAEMLTREQRQLIGDKLDAFEKKSGVKIAVVTVSSLEGKNIEEYARQLFAEWRVGTKGILFLIAPNEAKLRIVTGASVRRRSIPDARADEIMDTAILVPYRSGNKPQAILDGVIAITSAIDSVKASVPPSVKSAKAPLKQEKQIEKSATEQEKISWYFWVLGILGFIFLVLVLVRLGAGRMGRKEKTKAGLSPDPLPVKVEPIFPSPRPEPKEDPRSVVMQKRGPDLLKNLPGLVHEVETMLDSNKQEQATNIFGRAKKQWEKIQKELPKDTNNINWVKVYPQLNSVETHCLTVKELLNHATNRNGGTPSDK